MESKDAEIELLNALRDAVYAILMRAVDLPCRCCVDVGGLIRCRRCLLLECSYAERSH